MNSAHQLGTSLDTKSVVWYQRTQIKVSLTFAALPGAIAVLYLHSIGQKLSVYLLKLKVELSPGLI